jgi:hypothetical protein
MIKTLGRARQDQTMFASQVYEVLNWHTHACLGDIQDDAVRIGQVLNELDATHVPLAP